MARTNVVILNGFAAALLVAWTGCDSARPENAPPRENVRSTAAAVEGALPAEQYSQYCSCNAVIDCGALDPTTEHPAFVAGAVRIKENTTCANWAENPDGDVFPGLFLCPPGYALSDTLRPAAWACNTWAINPCHQNRYQRGCNCEGCASVEGVNGCEATTGGNVSGPPFLNAEGGKDMCPADDLVLCGDRWYNKRHYQCCTAMGSSWVQDKDEPCGDAPPTSDAGTSTMDADTSTMDTDAGP